MELKNLKVGETLVVGASDAWKKKGVTFKIKHDSGLLGMNNEFISVSAIHKGKVIGYAHLAIVDEASVLRLEAKGVPPTQGTSWPKTFLMSKSTHVDKAFRRMGIATEMYRVASEEAGLKVLPDFPSNQSSEGKALWREKNA